MSKEYGSDQGHTAFSCKLLDKLFFHHNQLALVNGDTCHIQLSSSNSSLHDFGCCWLLMHWLFFVLVFRLIKAALHLRQTMAVSYLWRNEARCAATESSRSTVDSIYRLQWFLLRICSMAVCCNKIIKGLDDG